MTAYLSANGAHVVTVNLLVPFYGAPVADVVLADATPLSGAVTLTIANLTLVMAVAFGASGAEQSGAFTGQTYARLVGGAGGWSQPVSLTPLRNPAGILLSTALGDVAMAAKNPVTGKAETVSLASGLDRSIGLFYAPPPSAPASRLLSALANPLWWVGTDGVTRVATTRTGSAIAATSAQVEMLSGSAGWARVATEDVASWATPGATYQSALVPAGITVNAARVHSGEDGVLRVEVLTR